MTDLHCHILPGVDDGADDLMEALEMAHLAAKSGVRTIVATPHCNLPYAEKRNYLDSRLLDRVADFRRAVEKANIPLQICAGAEVFCTPEVGELLREHRLLTLAGTKYLLMEFYFDESSDFMEECFAEVVSQGFLPVIAHPERYEAVQRAPHMIQRWFTRGYVIQLNKGSILGKLGSRAEAASRWILQRGLAHVVASDAHGVHLRSTYMGELLRHLETQYDPEYARILLSINPGKIVRDRPVLQP